MKLYARAWKGWLWHICVGETLDEFHCGKKVDWHHYSHLDEEDLAKEVACRNLTARYCLECERRWRETR